MANILQKMYDVIKSWRSPAWLKDLTNSLWSMLKEIISGSTEILLAQLKDIALEACLKVQNDPSLISDEAKRNKAFEEIVLKAKAKGLEVKDSIINLAIELAVSFLKTRIS